MQGKKGAVWFSKHFSSVASEFKTKKSDINKGSNSSLSNKILYSKERKKKKLEILCLR